MDRFALDKLIQWKDKKNRKPMILEGARQVGKTWLMKEFGRLCFKKTAYITFFNNTRMKRVFETDFDIDRILASLNVETHMEITPGDTLIILDEIQDAPKALESLKYFCENAPEYHVIAAGSLLGVAMHKGVSYPVGKVDILRLYPLSFMEFLTAVGEKGLASFVKEKKWEWLSDNREKYIYWLKNYYYVGGMPAVVDFFIHHKDYDEVRNIQNAIIEQYERDFGKHSETEALARTRIVWNAIPMQLAKENKKFFFGHIKKGARLKDYELAIEWLKDCGLIHRVYKVNKPSMPLKAYMDMSAFKLYLVDIGLLAAMSGLDAGTILDGNDIFVEFKGALTEQYVLQQLVSDTDHTPFYYTSEKSTYEMDFLIQKAREVIPVEVKAEVNLHAKSLKVYCQKFKPKTAIRTSMSDYKKEDWLINVPLYAIGYFLK